MKYFLIILSLFTTTILFGQKTKKVKNTIKEQFGKSTEVYYVFKSDKTTKHGEYIKKSKDRGVIEKGFYKYGVKDSLWTYYRNGKNQTLKSKGHFLNNEKIGEWNFYNFRGELIQTYDYSRDTILFEKGDTHRLKYTCSPKNDNLDSCKDPAIIGGYTVMQEIILRKLLYPPLAIENQIQGDVYISFEIDENGKGKNLELHKGIDPDLDAETLRVTKIILEEVRWYTWRQKNTFKVTMPIKFKLY